MEPYEAFQVIKMVMVDKWALLLSDIAQMTKQGDISVHSDFERFFKKNSISEVLNIC